MNIILHVWRQRNGDRKVNNLPPASLLTASLSDATFVQKLFSLLFFFNPSACILKSKHVYVKNGIIKRTDAGRKKKINVKPHHAA